MQNHMHTLHSSKLNNRNEASFLKNFAKNFFPVLCICLGLALSLIPTHSFAEDKSFEETFKHIKNKHKLYQVTSNRPLFFGDNLNEDQLHELEKAFGEIQQENSSFRNNRKNRRTFATPRKGILDPKINSTKNSAKSFNRGGINMEESIPYYFTKLEVLANGKVLVTETIAIISEGHNFKTGITRKLKKKFKNHLGEKQEVTYTISGVTHNKRAETYQIEKTNDEILLNIGDESQRLNNGVHIYTITYVADRLISYQQDADWLFYNVTGNDWPLPIIRVAAAVVLPHGLVATDQTGYTGLPGYEGQDIDLHIDGEGSRGFVVNRTLNKSEGFSLAVTWPGGYIEAPDSDRKMAFFLLDHGSFIAGLLGLLTIITYLLITWKLATNTSRSNRVKPVGSPPNELSAATIRQLVLGKKFDNKALTSTLVNMAVKGILSIQEDETGTFKIIKNKDDSSDLSHGERKVLRQLFGKTDTSIDVNEANNLKIKRAAKDLRQSLAAEYRRIFFAQNKAYVLTCLFMFIITMFAMTMMSLNPRDIIQTTGILCISIPLVFVFVAEAYTSKQEHKTRKSALFGALAISSITASIYFLSLYSYHTSVGTALIIPIIATCASIAINLFMSPKVLGGDIMLSLKGFRLYFIGNSTPAAKTGDKAMRQFNKLLPYALAMDAEKDWHKKFDEHFKEYKEHGVSWYTGRTFAEDVSKDITNALSSALSIALNIDAPEVKKSVRSRKRIKNLKNTGKS
ncbi:MAG: DUF2207 domain-containing protein [Alphaproteobacteria bacterium]|nr:DUF2207 domain-containing protein [Alphaproteobacteria bacterium]